MVGKAAPSSSYGHSGGLPCLRVGRGTCLVRSRASSAITRPRVLCGRMTSSMKPYLAACGGSSIEDRDHHGLWHKQLVSRSKTDSGWGPQKESFPLPKYEHHRLPERGC